MPGDKDSKFLKISYGEPTEIAPNSPSSPDEMDDLKPDVSPVQQIDNE
mgnify:CR=1 FL=1